MPKMRGNGSGSITKCKGRKTPYKVTITVGYEIDIITGKRKQKTKCLGYFKTRKIAEEELAKYNISPTNLNVKKMTFQELYMKWEPWYIAKHVKSNNYIRGIRSSYNYCSLIHNMKIRDIEPVHLKECMENAYVISTQGSDKGKKRYATANTKARMKSLFNLMFDYAVEHNYLVSNPARAFKIEESLLDTIQENRKVKPAFTCKSIEKLWQAYDMEYPFSDMVLIQIYTGYRASELVSIKLNHVYLDMDLIVGVGNKTKSGRDRIVPIHPKIKPLIEAQYNKAVEAGRDYLFFDLEGERNIDMTYSMYRNRFKKVVSFIGLPVDRYTTHSCRVSFITMAKAYNMDEHLMKLIIGHADEDLAERIYTRRVTVQLIDAINMIPMVLDDKYLSEDSILAIIQESIDNKEHLFV